MSNNNCLHGMRCPQCKAEEPFRFMSTVICTWHDDGTDDYSDLEFVDDGYAQCVSCHYTGVTRDFYISNQS